MTVCVFAGVIGVDRVEEDVTVWQFVTAAVQTGKGVSIFCILLVHY